MAGNRQRYQNAMSQGAEYAWDNNWQKAIEQLEIARSEFPDDPVPYSRLGQAYYELGDYERSLQHYQQAARLNPSDVATLVRIADILERLGQLDQAARTYMAVAEAFLRKREVEDAISNWERAARLDPGLMGARQRLALVYKQRGQIRDAVRQHLALARIYQSQNDIPQAAAVCKSALEMDPHNEDVLAAVALLKQGLSMDEADDRSSTFPTQRQTEAPAIAPSLADALRTAAQALETKEPSAAALQWDESTVVEEDPEFATSSPVEEARQTALANLAGIIFEEDSAGTGALMSKVDRDALISKAIDLQTRGDIDEAIAAYEQAIEGGVRQPAAHFNLGLLYQERLRLDEAIGQLQISLRDTEYKLGSHFALGECYRAKGRLDDALKHFMEVAKIVDMRTVNRDQVDDLVRLYGSLADTFAVKGEQEQAAAFANALVEFLSTKGWEDKVREARERLDGLAVDGQTMSLAEILAVPGSDNLLESISLANEYARRGWLDTAIEEAYRSVQQAPFYLPTHMLLARLLEQRGRVEAAGNKYVIVAQLYRARGDASRSMDAFEKAMTLAPLDMGLRSRLIDMLKRHGQIDRALEHSMALAEAHYQLAQIDKAREKYQDALHLAPRGSAANQWELKILHRIADIDLQRLSWRDAVTSYFQIVRIAPDDERASVTLIELLFKLGQSHQALGELDRFLARLAAEGKSKKILAILNSMASQQHDDMGLLNRLAAAYAQAGERNRAIESLDRLGELQLDAGLRAEAANTIRSILALRPADASGYEQLLAQISGAS